MTRQSFYTEIVKNRCITRVISRHPGIYLWVGIAALVLAWTGCGGRPGGKPGGSSDAPNVLLVTMDTTRADRLGCYGYVPAQTPTLDALARAGVRFDQAFCQVPLTLSSHVSLLTGTYPPSNGIHVNLGGRLSKDVPTLAEIFKANGYRTGGFIGAWVLNSGFGLARGFDRYDEKLTGEGEGINPYERPADAVCNAALSWLAEAPEKPFFAWVHFYDPHFPYTPPPAFSGKPADPYDGEIAFMDSQIRRLIEWLDGSGRRERTLIVLVGDHGEAFNEHEEIQHGYFLYEPTMRVPLIFGFPKRLPAGRVVTAGVRLVDLMPTILDLSGLKPPSGLSGVSLTPAMESGNFAALPAYGETEYPLSSFGWAPLRSYTTDKWKYIDAPQRELYDRANDRAEQHNVVTENPEVAAKLEKELRALTARMVKRTAEKIVPDEEALKILQSLGYVAGSSSTPDKLPDGRPRRDPKEMVAVFRRMMEAKTMVVEGRNAEAVRLLEPLVVQSPESNELHSVLAEAYLNLNRPAEAEREYRAGLQNIPNDPRSLCRLGDALLAQKKVPEAVDCYRKVLEVSDTYVPAYSRLGGICFESKQFDKAEEYFRRAVQIDPHTAANLTNLATTLLATGRYGDAIPYFQDALRYDAKSLAAHQNYWQALIGAGRRVEAIQALRAAMPNVPNPSFLKRNLAGLLATTPQAGPGAVEEAYRLARECCDAEPTNPECFDVLAVTYAAQGNFGRAVETARYAVALAQKQGNPQLAEGIKARMQVYQGGRIQ